MIVLTPNYGPRSDLRWLDLSAKRFGIELQTWPQPQKPWGGTIQSALDGLEALKVARRHSTHFLQTDGRDAIFVTGLKEIEQKYRDLGSPKWLVSAEMAPYPLTDLGGHPRFESESPYKYPNCGGHMGEIDYVIAKYEWMLANYSHDDNPQGMAMRGFTEGVLLEAEIDNRCEIFQCWEGVLEASAFFKSRICNVCTGAYPCVLHFHGGYWCPENGKDERIKPIWELLYGRPE